MVVKAALFVLHVLINVLYLAKHVGVVLAAVFLGVEGAEYLCHVDAVKPDLVGIDKLVPEVACAGSWLTVKLLLLILNGGAILFLTRLAVKLEENSSLIQVVKVVFLNVIAEDRAVICHVVVNEALGKVEVFFLAGNLAERQKRGDHTSVNVVPMGLLALTDALNIPYRKVGSGLCYKSLYVFVDILVHCPAPFGIIL